MKLKDIFECLGNGVMYVLTFTQTKEIFEIISLVLSILISVVILVSKIIQWWKESKQDGKIDKEEIDNLVDILQEGKNEIDNHINKEDK